jgi:hypothetical protein
VQKDVSNAIPNSDLTLEDLPPKILGDRSLVCKTVLPDNTTDVGNIISGTYVHSLLIPHIAGCISPEFQIKANEVVNGYIVHEYKHLIFAFGIHKQEKFSLRLLNNSQFLLK